MGVLRALQTVFGRSRLLWLVGVTFVVFFAVAFVDLAVTRANMEAQYRQAADTVDRLGRQNALLQQELDRSQDDEHVPFWGWEYFNLTPKGTGVIVGEGPEAPAAEAAPGVERSAEPFWNELWKRLRQP